MTISKTLLCSLCNFSFTTSESQTFSKLPQTQTMFWNRGQIVFVIACHPLSFQETILRTVILWESIAYVILM